MAITIEDRDLGWTAIAAAVEALDGTEIRVGSTGEAATALYIEPESGDETDFSVAVLLSWHEFGIGVPERSLVRAWADSKPREFKDRTIVEPFAVALEGGNGLGKLDGAGEKLAASMLRYLDAGISPGPSAITLEARRRPSALARDSGERSLLDSLQIRGSISFRVD